MTKLHKKILGVISLAVIAISLTLSGVANFSQATLFILIGSLILNLYLCGNDNAG